MLKWYSVLKTDKSALNYCNFIIKCRDSNSVPLDILAFFDEINITPVLIIDSLLAKNSFKKFVKSIQWDYSFVKTPIVKYSKLIHTFYNNDLFTLTYKFSYIDYFRKQIMPKYSNNLN